MDRESRNSKRTSGDKLPICRNAEYPAPHTAIFSDLLGPPTPDDLNRLPQPALDLALVAHLAVPVVDPVLRRLLREMAMPFGDLGVARRAQHRRLPQLRRPIIAERCIFGASALAAFEIRHWCCPLRL